MISPGSGLFADVPPNVIQNCPMIRIAVSFATPGHFRMQPFPRRLESTSQIMVNAPPKNWIPACEGMTGDLTISNNPATL
jgi:hypothetical protein